MRAWLNPTNAGLAKRERTAIKQQMKIDSGNVGHVLDKRKRVEEQREIHRSTFSPFKSMRSSSAPLPRVREVEKSTTRGFAMGKTPEKIENCEKDKELNTKYHPGPGRGLLSRTFEYTRPPL